MGLAGDGCRGEQCLFGVELIKSHSHSHTAYHSLCLLWQDGCCATLAASVLRLLSLVEVTQ